ncbi:MAG: alpha-mannosidase [Anaerolineae bacterium]|nr:alpha-mannosidase [Anaerolineae bacterium]
MESYRSTYINITQSLQYSLQRQAQRLERFTAQLAFADRLSVYAPNLEQAALWRERILDAGHIVQAGLKARCVDIEDLIAQGEAALFPLSEVAKTYTLLCISHAHIDMNWMWAWPETVAVVNDTFQTMLALMDEFSGFIFSQDQASTYAIVEKYNPVMFEIIRQRVQEGRWEVTASQWVEGDKNMASGESLSRHLLHTRRYFQEKFGLAPEDVRVDFEPDTFGHPATLPAILARGGVDYYYHCRGSHGPHLYWWLGPDGSRLLVFNDIQWYMPVTGTNISVTPVIADPVVEFAQTTGLKQMPMLYGVGDHGGGPTRQDLRRLIEMDSWPVFPNVRFSTLHNFFETAEAALTAGIAHVQEISGERNSIFTGCYTSQARQKWANRHGENLLYAAEAAAVVGERLAGMEYPGANLEQAWTYLLFDQFHDILPGSGIRETRHYTLGHAQETQAAAGIALTNALRALAARVNTAALRRDFDPEGKAVYSERDYKDSIESDRSGGAGVGNASGTGHPSTFSVAQTSDRAFLVFNPLPFARTEIVEVKVWDTQLDEKLLIVTSDGASARPVQVLEKGKYWGHTYLTVAFPVTVPGLGYRVVCISDRSAELGLIQEMIGDPWVATAESPRQILPPDMTLENEYLKVRLDSASGGIVSLVDKQTGREWIPEGKLAGVLQYCVEANKGMSAWVIGNFLKQEDLLKGGVLKRVQTGPYINTYRWTRKVSASTLTLDITVRRGEPRVEFRLRVDWREMGDMELGIPQLRVNFPLAVSEPQPRYEIPFGSLPRDLRAGEEVVAQRWADVSGDDGAGVTLVNTSKYGHSFDKDTLGLTLLRASIDPDPLPDLGEHIIEYALAPHDAGWRVGDSMQVGESLNIPLSVISCDFQEGELPSTLSLCVVENSNVRLTAIKKAARDEGIILRLVEVEGRATDARVILAPELHVATVAEMDILEQPLSIDTARLEGNVVSVTLPAFGVATMHLI